MSNHTEEQQVSFITRLESSGWADDLESVVILTFARWVLKTCKQGSHSLEPQMAVRHKMFQSYMTVFTTVCNFILECVCARARKYRDRIHIRTSCIRAAIFSICIGVRRMILHRATALHLIIETHAFVYRNVGNEVGDMHHLCLDLPSQAPVAVAVQAMDHMGSSNSDPFQDLN
eukprot:2086305-Amphidinium_carterae.1